MSKLIIAKILVFCALLFSLPVFAASVPEFARRTDVPFINCKSSPYNPTGLGVADDRAALQACLTAGEGKTVHIPEGTYLIAPNGGTGGLKIPSNTTVIFAPNAILKAANVAWAAKGVLNVLNKTNVRMFGGQIDGDKANNPRPSMLGLEIFHSTNVLVDGMIARNVPGSSLTGGNAGDGFYIDGAPGSAGGSNITIQNCIADSNVRQGISIIKGSDIKILTNKIINTSGSNPGAGIDLETDHVSDVLTKVLIQDNYIAANHRGIVVAGKKAVPSKVTIRNNDLIDNRHMALSISGNDHIIEGNHIQRPTHPVIGGYSNVFSGGGRMRVSGNVFEGRIDDTNEAALILLRNLFDFSFIDNKVFNSYNIGLKINQEVSFAKDAKRLIITNNNFYNNRGTRSGNVILVASKIGNTITELIFKDNIVWDDGALGRLTGFNVIGVTLADAATWQIGPNKIGGPGITTKYAGFPVGTNFGTNF